MKRFLRWGLFAGIAWDINENLSIGPGFGAFTQIEDDDLDVFPILLVDWDITPKLSLSTNRIEREKTE